MPDWNSIRADYEVGLSFGTIATKYDVGKTTVYKRSLKDGWERKGNIPVTPVPIVPTEELPDLSTVEKAIMLIAERLDKKPENKDIKMLMDSLSQAYKIKMLLPSEQGQTEDSVRELLQYCTDEEIAIIKPVLAAATLRKQSEQENIHPIRRVG